MSKVGKFRYGRIYKAYFFEQPITYPVSVSVIARSFEEALGLVREQFPDRTISAFHSEDRNRLVADYDAVIIAPGLPRTEPPQLTRNVDGIPEECTREWYNFPKHEPESSEETEPGVAESAPAGEKG